METKYNKAWLKKIVYKEEILDEQELLENYDEVRRCLGYYLEKNHC